MGARASATAKSVYRAIPKVKDILMKMNRIQILMNGNKMNYYKHGKMKKIMTKVFDDIFDHQIGDRTGRR